MKNIAKEFAGQPSSSSTGGRGRRVGIRAAAQESVLVGSVFRFFCGLLDGMSSKMGLFRNGNGY
jgi:hypothetical protein